MVREVFHGKGTTRYFETLDEIERVWAKVPPAERKPLVDFIRVNTEHKTAGAKNLVQVWALRITYYLGFEHRNKRIITGAWGFAEKPAGWSKQSWDSYVANNAGPRKGLTANQMRRVVGLPAIKEKLRVPVSKDNPKGLRSRSSGPAVSLGEVSQRRKPIPKGRTR